MTSAEIEAKFEKQTKEINKAKGNTTRLKNELAASKKEIAELGARIANLEQDKK